MARKKKQSDPFYNARRRYYRAAERSMKKAEQASGATAEKYRTLARRDLDKALSTYDQSTTQNFSKPIRSLAEKLGVNLGAQRKRLQDMSEKAAKSARELAEKKSTKRLEKELRDRETRRQEQARIVFDSGIGSRIIGGTVDIWRKSAIDESGKVDKGKMMQAIFDYFKVDNVADLLEKVESALGEMLYRGGDAEMLYESVKLTIQSKVADNTLVA